MRNPISPQWSAIFSISAEDDDISFDRTKNPQLSPCETKHEIGPRWKLLEKNIERDLGSVFSKEVTITDLVPAWVSNDVWRTHGTRPTGKNAQIDRRIVKHPGRCAQRSRSRQ